jgi:hypothetical protein
VPYLKPTESGKNLCFDNDAKELLMEAFPKDPILGPPAPRTGRPWCLRPGAVNSLKKKERAIQQYDKLLRFADQDRFYPNYIMFCQATTRFSTRDPEFHNFISKPVDFFAKASPLAVGPRALRPGAEGHKDGAPLVPPTGAGRKSSGL